MQVKEATVKTSSSAALLCAIAISSITAQAGPITIVDIFKPGGIVPIAAGVQTVQWQDGSDASIGFTGVPGSTFLNLYQSTAKGFLDQNSQSITPAAGFGLAFSDSSAYELSIVSRAQFQVAGSGSGTLYDLVPGSGTLSIYLDGPGVGSTGVQADPLTGIGFDDGIEIFRAVPFGGSAFLQGTVVVDELDLLASMVRADVLVGAASIGDFHFSDTKQLSPTFVTQGFHINGDSVLYPDYVPSPRGNGVIELINSNAQFSTETPEPSTMVLVSLAGVIAFVYRRCFYSRSPGSPS